MDTKIVKKSRLHRDDVHTISVFVSNKPGVLLRVCLVFSRRAFNIESLVVSPALDGRFSRMTITASGDRQVLDQIIKQTSKIVDVVHCVEHNEDNAIEKELALIKVKASKETRTGILQLIQHFKAQTVDIGPKSLIIQITGNTEKLDAMIDMLEPYGLIEVVRTGKIVMARGSEKT